MDSGTLFTPTNVDSEQDVRNLIIANFSPPIVSAQELQTTADKLIELYPDIPALGSPFNTGNETFGLSSVYKQAAALGTYLMHIFLHSTRMLTRIMEDGDVAFQAVRRNFNQVAATAGLKNYGYLFTEPQPASGRLGGTFVSPRSNLIHLI